MVECVPYEPQHFEKINLRSCHNKEQISGIGTEAVTFMSMDQPVAILGGYFLNPATFQVWGILSDEVQRCPVAFHKAVKSMVDSRMGMNGVCRMQMSVRADYEMGQKWARALGFLPEGRMVKYGPDGSDYYLFARVA